MTTSTKGTTMPTTASPTAARHRTDPLRRTAFLAGALYLVTFVAGIPPALTLYAPVLTDPAYVLTPGGDTPLLWGALLDMVNAFACIGTAVVLFPVVKRQNETLALGFVTSRVMEATIIATGVISLLAVVTLHREASTLGADPGTLVATQAALVAIRDWTFLLGPGIMPVVNALLLGTLMYRSRLVPRVIPLMGLIGAPLLLAANLATMFGLNEQLSAASSLAVVGIFFWELSLGVYLVVKGFRPSPITVDLVRTATVGGDAARSGSVTR
jgi:hypothetical protein